MEECIKVLFHECIHALRFSSIKDSKEIVDKYNRLYNNTSDKMLIDEAYTEIWAKVLNCYFVAKISSFNEEDLDLYKYFCILLIYSLSVFAHHPEHTIQATEPYPVIWISDYQDNVDGHNIKIHLENFSQ